MSFCIEGDSGQSTVEAAFLLPVFLLVLALLLQPAIVLYDRCVMQSAAAEACRLVSTGVGMDGSTEAFVARRLAAIPAADVFHMSGEEWDVQVEGGELSGVVRVSIAGHCRPLPLFGILAGLAGQTDGGLIRLEASSAMRETPEWVASLGSGPAEWISKWK